MSAAPDFSDEQIDHLLDWLDAYHVQADAQIHASEEPIDIRYDETRRDIVRAWLAGRTEL